MFLICFASEMTMRLSASASGVLAETLTRSHTHNTKSTSETIGREEGMRGWGDGGVRARHEKAMQICISIHNTKTIHTLRFWLIESFVLFRGRRKKEKTTKEERGKKTYRFSFAFECDIRNAVYFLTLCTFHGTIVNLNNTKWIYFYSVAKATSSLSYLPSGIFGGFQQWKPKQPHCYFSRSVRWRGRKFSHHHFVAEFDRKIIMRFLPSTAWRSVVNVITL